MPALCEVREILPPERVERVMLRGTREEREAARRGLWLVQRDRVRASALMMRPSDAVPAWSERDAR